MELPLIGWIFRLKETEAQKNELVVFLTPRIVSNGEAP
jgi:type II secretory pathway component HofQ